MKCYFCLTAPNSENLVYVDLLEVSLISARKNTTLDLYAIYDGPRNHKVFEILNKYKVKIIEKPFSHKLYLRNVYTKEYMLEKFGKELPLDKIAGTFMRFDIPFIEKEENFVLYSDIDVMFLADIQLKDIKLPDLLSASSEFEKDFDNFTYFNAGVMFLNIAKMREVCNLVFCDLKKGIPNKIGLFDQGFLNQYCIDSFTRLPLEFNWKPYWGINPSAKILHFHGIKPAGTNENSGFAMSDAFLLNTIKRENESINGYIHYFTMYYDFLNKDIAPWLKSFMIQTNNVLTREVLQLENSHCQLEASFHNLENQYYLLNRMHTILLSKVARVNELIDIVSKFSIFKFLKYTILSVLLFGQVTNKLKQKKSKQHLAYIYIRKLYRYKIHEK